MSVSAVTPYAPVGVVGLADSIRQLERLAAELRAQFEQVLHDQNVDEESRERRRRPLQDQLRGVEARLAQRRAAEGAGKGSAPETPAPPHPRGDGHIDFEG